MLYSWLVERLPVVWLTKLHLAVAVGCLLFVVASLIGLAVPFLEEDDPPQQCNAAWTGDCRDPTDLGYWECRQACFDEISFIASLVVVQTLSGLAVVAWLTWQFHIRALVPQSRPASWSRLGMYAIGATVLAAAPFGLMCSLHTRHGASAFFDVVRIEMLDYGLICTVLMVFLLGLTVVLTHGRPVIGAVAYICTNVIGYSLLVFASIAQDMNWLWAYYLVGTALAAILGIAGTMALLPATERFRARSAVALSVVLAMVPFAPLVGAEFVSPYDQDMFDIDNLAFAMRYGFGIGVLVVSAPIWNRQLELMRSLPK